VIILSKFAIKLSLVLTYLRTLWSSRKETGGEAKKGTGIQFPLLPSIETDVIWWGR